MKWLHGIKGIKAEYEDSVGGGCISNDGSMVQQEGVLHYNDIVQDISGESQYVEDTWSGWFMPYENTTFVGSFFLATASL